MIGLFINKRLRRLIRALSLSLISILIGIIVYMTLEGFNLNDAFYMTVITLSTVGFNEVQPLSDAGQLFTSFYIIGNLAIFAYLISTITTYIFEGELNQALNIYLMGQEVKKLKNHVIVCGYGRNGSRVIEELSKSNRSFIIVDKDESIFDSMPDKYRYITIIGDATLDEILLEAGVDRASSIITTLPNDAENVFITLTSKELNKSIRVISRATDEKTEKKLYRAGASNVIMPDALGGVHMANIITKPFVIELLSILNGMTETEYLLEQISYDNLKPEYRDRPIKELGIREKTGMSILGFKDPDKGMLFNPGPHMKITEDDVIILLGYKSDVIKFRKEFAID